jgi:putative ABC transport system permease protein
MLKIFQSIRVGMKMSVVEMGSHKLRSVLSMLGVLLGVASLVAMLTLIGGIDRFLNQRMAKWAGSIWFWNKSQPEENEKIAWSRSPGLRFSDGTYLEEHAEEAQHYWPIIERRTNVTIKGRSHHAHVRGVDSLTLAEDLENIEVRRGQNLRPEDFEKGASVCLITWQLEEWVQKAMGIAEIDSGLLVGDLVSYKNAQFRIIGVAYPRDEDFKPWHLRHAVIIPLRTMLEHVSGFDPDPGSIRMSVADPGKIEQQSKAIARHMTARHRGVEDFEYRTAHWLEDITRMLNNATVLMSIVSLISLLVGGMSIMNVMLSSISERIHEIGVRKALGAQNLQIFIQFLAEATTLCFIGGIIGAVLGLLPLAFGDQIQASTDGAIQPTILPLHVVFVFTIIATVGIIFGLYPAFKAVRMDPVEALRYE